MTLRGNANRVLRWVVFLVLIPVAGVIWGNTEKSAESSNSADAADRSDTKKSADSINATQTKFTVSPNRCVTLRQGQPCFVKLRFEWQSTEIVQVCVYGMNNEKLKCWSDTSTGTVLMPQTLPGTTEYVLKDDTGTELNKSSVSVSWVYRKKRSKRRWRLF